MRTFLIVLMMSILCITACGKKDPPISGEIPASSTDQSAPAPGTPTDSQVQEAPPIEPTASTDSENKFMGKMEDLMKKGGKMTCSLTAFASGNTIEGTTFIDGSKIRTDTLIKTEDKDISQHMLLIDDITYTWDDETKMVMKFKQLKGSGSTDTSDVPLPGDEDQEVSTDDVEYQFDCKEGVADLGVFAVPSDLPVQDMTNLQQNLPTISPEMMKLGQ